MLHLITPSVEMPVLLAEAKLHLRVDFDDDDTAIAAMIAAAVGRLDGPDGYLGRCLMPQVWRLDLDELRGVITLPLPPCQDVTSITYLDKDGEQQVLGASMYRVRGIGDVARINPVGDWPETDSASITFVAGYAVTPEPIRAAILLRVGHLFANRESVVVGESVAGLPLGEDDLIRNYRVWGF